MIASLLTACSAAPAADRWLDAVARRDDADAFALLDPLFEGCADGDGAVDPC